MSGLHPLLQGADAPMTGRTSSRVVALYALSRNVSGDARIATVAVSDWQLNETYHSSSGQVCYDVLGDAGSEPVALLHGTPFSSYVWRGIAGALACDHQVYVWDMPGYGTSEKAEGQDVSLRAQGRVFVELLTHWALSDDAWIPVTKGRELASRIPRAQLRLMLGAGHLVQGRSPDAPNGSPSTKPGQLQPAARAVLGPGWVEPGSPECAPDRPGGRPRCGWV